MKVGRTCPELRTFVRNITRDADRLSPCSIFRPPKRRHANAQRRDVDGSVRLPMQTPLAVQLRQSLTPVAKGNESLQSASSPMHNVVPRKRNMERCKPFFVSPLASSLSARSPRAGLADRWAICSSGAVSGLSATLERADHSPKRNQPARTAAAAGRSNSHCSLVLANPFCRTSGRFSDCPMLPQYWPAKKLPRSRS